MRGALRTLAARSQALHLRRSFRELTENGWTILRHPQAAGMAGDIRSGILRAAQQTEGAGRGYAAALLLGQDDVFTRAATFGPLLALVHAVLGRGAVLSQMVGSVRTRRSASLDLHSDNGWFPEPFPEWELSCTACWTTDPFTSAGGATLVVPGSHRLRRHPGPRDRGALSSAVALEAPAGAICIWLGSLWHAAPPRALEGERVVLHITFNRMGIQPIEDYRHLSDDWIGRQSPRLGPLLGRGSVFGTSTMTSGGPDPDAALRTLQMGRGGRR